MSEFVEIKTAELVGPALDWAVANATEAWEFAHEWFPTMTLDPRFIGIRNVAVDGCVWLEPRNPFRQDPQPFRPSTDWAQGGPLIDKYQLTVSSPKSPVHRNGGPLNGWNESGLWTACTWEKGVTGKRAVAWDKESPLVAACRAIVTAKLGDVVQVPVDLVGVAA